MASSEQRKALEQLMGAPASNEPQLPIDDPSVCRSFICGACPHDLFINTKASIGTCMRRHSEGLKVQYEAASEEQKRNWNLEYDYVLHLDLHINKCNVNINQSEQRLDLTSNEVSRSNDLVRDMDELDATNQAGIEELELLCQLGMTNFASQDFFKVRQACAIKKDKEKDLQNVKDTGGSSGHQKLQVCDVCGAYLSRLDNDRRLADHFWGKMHLGYAQIRAESVKWSPVVNGRPRPARYQNFGDRAVPNGDYAGAGGYGGGAPGGGSGYRGGWRGRGGPRGGRGRGRGGSYGS